MMGLTGTGACRTMDPRSGDFGAWGSVDLPLSTPIGCSEAQEWASSVPAPYGSAPGHVKMEGRERARRRGGHPMNKKIASRVVAIAVVVSATGVLVSPTAWATKGIHNFGGYSAPVVGAASADITVPAASSISCSSAKTSLVEMWVALTRGAFVANAGLNVQCIHGTPITNVTGAAGTASFRFPVNGGDVISISTSETATSTSVTASDTTTGVNETANSLGSSLAPTVVQFGAISTSKTLPNFGPITYSSVTVDGAQIDPTVSTQRKLTRGHPPGVIPGALASGSFTLTES
jgi:hypothetical protein